MSQAEHPDHHGRHELAEKADALLQERCQDELARLAQEYPNDSRSIVIDHSAIYDFDPGFADDLLEAPEKIIGAIEEALRLLDDVGGVPVGFENARVRVGGLSETYTFYPNEFSPTKQAGNYRTIVGDVLVTTDTYSKVQVAAFECQRCGTLTRIPQTSEGWQEPHECQGCERQGPFEINYEQSEFVDGETIQLQTPPGRAAGTGRTLQVFIEDDICGQVEMGDRIAVSGILRLNQKSSGGKKKVEFEPYLQGKHVRIEDSSKADIDADAETKERVHDLAAGDEGDPLDVAADSYHPKVYGYETQKKALVLSIVGGATNTDDHRGEFHVLFIGDPSTAKSQLVNQVPEIAPRAMSVSSTSASSAGLTSTATQGEFSDGRWTLSPGVFAKANEGIVSIDELDDMEPADRAAMLEPMANQEINVSKAGINATLSTQTAVVAAANPKHSRFDPFEPIKEQFGFESNLLSRFDLVFTFRDQPDEQDDRDIADHTTKFNDAKIRQERGMDVPEEEVEAVDQPVDTETLRVWLTLAKQQPDPVYESDAVRKRLRDRFVTLRGANGYEEGAEVPVTFRKLEGVERIARAHAKLEFSDVVTERHVDAACELVGTSLNQYQKTEDGTLDADIAETGSSKSQKDRKRDVVETIKDLQSEADGDAVEESAVIETLEGDYDPSKVEDDLWSLKFEDGDASEPKTGYIRYLGDW